MASVSQTEGLHWCLWGGSSADIPPMLCSLPPVDLTTSAFKKNKHSRDLRDLDTKLLAPQCSNSWCHPVPRSQPGSLLLPEELGNPSKKRGGESGLFARGAVGASPGGCSPSGPRGRDLAQEEQEQSLAEGPGAAVTPQEAAVSPR